MSTQSNFQAGVSGLIEKKADEFAQKVRASKFISLGSGTPFELIESSTLHVNTKAYLRNELITGNEYVMDRFLKYRETHPMEAPARKVEFDYAVAGDFVDVGRYMGGEPEFMVDFSQLVETQFVDFYINIDTCGSVNDQNAFAYYAAAVSVVDSLENSGYRVRLTGVNYSDAINKGKVYEVTTIIKDYNEPINYAYLTSICMAQTSFFSAIMQRPGQDLYKFCGCDYLPAFEPNITMNENTFYAPSLYGRNSDGKVYSTLNHTPGAFSFDSLIKDWKLDHLIKK